MFSIIVNININFKSPPPIPSLNRARQTKNIKPTDNNVRNKGAVSDEMTILIMNRYTKCLSLTSLFFISLKPRYNKNIPIKKAINTSIIYLTLNVLNTKKPIRMIDIKVRVSSRLISFPPSYLQDTTYL